MKQLNDIEHKRVLGERLGERIEAEFDAARCAGCLCRFEAGMHDVSFVGWANAQRAGVKTYFSSRDDDFEMAGVNVADIVVDDGKADAGELFAEIEGRVAKAFGAVKYYGGIAFNADAEIGADWEKFGVFRFVVPQVELARQGGKVTIAFNVLAGADDSVASITDKMLGAIEGLVFGVDSGEGQDCEMTALSRTDLPGREQWIDNVESVVRDIGDGKLAKLVLARRTRLKMSGAVKPFVLLNGITNGGASTYDFCFEVDGGVAFVGASPERLFRTEGRVMFAEALAGTRGTDCGEEVGGLLDSDKEVMEHNFVVDDVAGSLEGLCENVERVAEKQIVRLPNLEHICTAFKGELREGVTVGEIIGSIHPTSAVNGVARGYALQEIERLEGFGRGHYAGPVGWIGKDGADFAVAIRSAVVAGDVISLYAGAGIVESSEAALEWEETETKISRFMQAVGQ